MSYDANTINNILIEYERMRNNASFERRARLDEVYKKLPQVFEIDNELNRIGFSVTRDIFANPNKALELKANMQKMMERLISQRDELLKAYGYPVNYTDIKYRCSDCNDTGYTEDNKRCKCLEQRLINVAYEQSELSHLIKTQNFNTFNFELYPRFSTSDKQASPYEQMLGIYNTAIDYVENFDASEKSLLFYGGTGLGKTFLSCCIAKGLLDKGKTVLYIRTTKLLSLYEDYRFNRVDMENAKKQLDRLYDVDLLILDDLGSESQIKQSSSLILDIMDVRLPQNKKMLISTNLSISELNTIYSNRLVSRIWQHFLTLQFIGEDIRMKL